MTFKSTTWLILTASFMILTQSACDRFIKSKTKPQSVPEIQLSKSQCKDQLSKNLKDFFQADEPSEEAAKGLDQAEACVDQMIDEFGSHTKGAKPGVYSSEEIRHFVEKYLAKKAVPEALMIQLMKLKVALWGGDLTSVSKAEIEDFKSTLNMIKKLVIELGPHKAILTLKKPLDTRQTVDKEKLRQALEVLNRTGAALLERLGWLQKNYDLDQFLELYHQLLAFSAEEKVPSESSMTKVIQKDSALATLAKPLALDQKVELFRQVYSLLLGGANYSAETWSVMVHFWGSYLEFKSTILESHFVMEDFLTADAWLVQFFNELTTALKIKSNHEITSSELEWLFKNWLAQKPNAKGDGKTWLRAFQKFVRWFLDPTHSETNTSFKLSHLNSLRSEYEVLAVRQRYLLGVGLDTNFDSQGLTRLAPLAPIINEVYVDSWDRSLHSKKGFDNLAGPLTHTGFDLAVTHILYGFSQWLMRAMSEAASHDFKDPVKTMTLVEMRKAYAEFSEFGQSLGVLDSRSRDPGQRTLKEADLFGRSSNGDGVLTLRELTEEFSDLLSRGYVLTQDIYELSFKEACGEKELDHFQRPYLRTDCFLHIMVEKSPDLMGRSFAYDELESLLAVSRLCSTGITTRVETAEVRTMFMINNYIETLFTSYDLNRDGLLDESEVIASWPRFRTFITEALKANLEKEHTTTYNYLFSNQENSKSRGENVAKFVFKKLIFEGKFPITSFDALTSAFKEVIHSYSSEYFRPAPINKAQLLKVFGEMKQVMGSTSSGCASIPAK